MNDYVILHRIMCLATVPFYMHRRLKFMFYGTISLMTILRQGKYCRRKGVKYASWVITCFLSTATKLTGDLINLIQRVRVVSDEAWSIPLISKIM